MDDQHRSAGGHSKKTKKAITPQESFVVKGGKGASLSITKSAPTTTFDVDEDYSDNDAGRDTPQTAAAATSVDQTQQDILHTLVAMQAQLQSFQALKTQLVSLTQSVQLLQQDAEKRVNTVPTTPTFVGGGEGSISVTTTPANVQPSTSVLSDVVSPQSSASAEIVTTKSVSLLSSATDHSQLSVSTPIEPTTSSQLTIATPVVITAPVPAISASVVPTSSVAQNLSASVTRNQDGHLFRTTLTNAPVYTYKSRADNLEQYLADVKTRVKLLAESESCSAEYMLKLESYSIVAGLAADIRADLATQFSGVDLYQSNPTQLRDYLFQWYSQGRSSLEQLNDCHAWAPTAFPDYSYETTGAFIRKFEHFMQLAQVTEPSSITLELWKCLPQAMQDVISRDLQYVHPGKNIVIQTLPPNELKGYVNQAARALAKTQVAANSARPAFVAAAFSHPRDKRTSSDDTILPPWKQNQTVRFRGLKSSPRVPKRCDYHPNSRSHDTTECNLHKQHVAESLQSRTNAPISASSGRKMLTITDGKTVGKAE